MSSPLDEIKKIKQGFPLTYFNGLRQEIDLPEKRLAAVLRIPVSTLATRKKRGRFTFPESERLARVRRVYTRAIEVFGTPDLAKHWLKEPLHILDFIAPLDFLDTEIGAMEVETLLGRLEHGVFS